MTDIPLLKEKMKKSGMTTIAICNKSGILRQTLYNRMRNVGEFTASEIVALSSTLNLTAEERDKIFLQ